MPRLKTESPAYRVSHRFGYIRSSLPFLALIIIFSISLASYSLLSHFASPASKQRIGWQAWDVVEIHSQSSAAGGELETVGNASDSAFVPSIPLDNWVSQSPRYSYQVLITIALFQDPLAMHTTGRRSKSLVVLKSSLAVFLAAAAVSYEFSLTSPGSH